MRATPLFLIALLTAGCGGVEAPPPAPTADYDAGHEAEEYGDPGDPPPAGGGHAAPASDWSPSGTTEAVEEVPVSAPEIDLVALENMTPIGGGEFNKFFPEQGGEWDIVYKQEKEGFAAASLQTGGEEAALLTIADLAGNATTADKFRDATNTVGGYPMTKSGSKGTVVLVGGRFQVQVRSADGSLGADERTAWLKKFDLDGLAGLAK